MSVDSSSALSAVESGAGSGSVNMGYAVGMLRKAQDQQRVQGEEAVRLIDSATPQMTKTPDGHISVRA
jgi:hypothetical protein